MRFWKLQLLWAGLVLSNVLAAAAAEAPSLLGTLVAGGKTYRLAHGAAYEIKPDDEPLLVVLASSARLPTERIEAALAESSGESDDGLSLGQPYVKIIFDRQGAVQSYQGWANNSSFSGGGAEALLDLSGDRVRGKAELPVAGEEATLRGFAFQFDLPLGAAAAAEPKPKRTGPVKASVTGDFLGNGKAARLAFVSAHRIEPFNGKPAVQLVFTEKDHARAARPELKASFGEFGSALLISINEEGGIFGCEVAHSAHGKQPFSSVGRIQCSDFEIGENFIEGRISTEGEQEFFDKTWQVDLKFSAPLPPAPASLAAKPGSKPADKPAQKPMTKPAAKPAPAPPQAATVNVHDLPLPADASNVQFKQLVEQIVFQSKTKVQTLAGDLAKKLKAQGWSSQGGDLITPASAILNRTRGEAKLTIMVKPSGGGSEVMIFANGLDWEEK